MAPSSNETLCKGWTVELHSDIWHWQRFVNAGERSWQAVVSSYSFAENAPSVWCKGLRIKSSTKLHSCLLNVGWIYCIRSNRFCFVCSWGASRRPCAGVNDLRSPLNPRESFLSLCLRCVRPQRTAGCGLNFRLSKINVTTTVLYFGMIKVQDSAVLCQPPRA